MATEYSRIVTQTAVAQIAETTGFETMQQSAVDVLSDLLLRYIGEIGVTAHNYAELSNRANPSADDLLMAFKDLGIRLEDVVAYTNAQEEVQFAHTMPPYPVQRTPKWPPTFARRKEEPPPHVPAWLPALPDQHTYLATPAFAGHDADVRRQRAAATKAKRQAEKSLVRLSERMGTAPGADAASAAAPFGGNPFLAAPSWETASAAPAADLRLDGGAAPAGQPADTDMATVEAQGSLADVFGAAAAAASERKKQQPTGSWAEAGMAVARPPDALGGPVPAFTLDLSGSGRLHAPLPAFSEPDDAFAAAEEASAAADRESRLKATGRKGNPGRARAQRADAELERAKDILAAGADAVLTLGEDRDPPGGGEHM